MNNEMSVVLGTVAMEPKGEYNSSTYYDKLNTVTYEGYTYIAKQPCQNIAPTNSDYWQKISGGIAPSEIVDNLESTATNQPLSANQGKVLNQKINNNILSKLNFKINNEIILDKSDTYEGSSYTQLQGFCYAENNIIMALMNDNKQSNNVKLVEYNHLTNQIVRYSYLELYHANSIAYNAVDKLLYVATLTRIDNNVEIPINDIIVIDYTNFEIVKTIQLSNIPENQRIRSLSYDNNTLYAANITRLFKIDEENETIIETIILDTSNINVRETNQTLKKVGNYFVGIWLSYIAFWDLSGNLVKVINVDRYQGGIKIGEIEDFQIFENNDIIIGSVVTNQQYENTRTIYYLQSNLYSNTPNEFRPGLGGTTDSNIIINVNNNSSESYQDGTSEYPYKNLQNVLNIIKNINETVNIHLYGDSYDFSSINGARECNFIIHSNIEIDGLNIVNSNVFINCLENSSLTINGLRVIRSKFYIKGYNDLNKVTINPINNDLITVVNGRRKCIFSQFSEIYCENINFLGENNDSLINGENSNFKFNSCNFDNYTGDYALRLNYCSMCLLNSCVFNIPVSDSQHNIYVSNGSVLYTQSNLSNIKNYVCSYQGKVYGHRFYEENINKVYYGEVCTVNTEFKKMRISLSVGGSRTNKKYFEMPTKDTTQILVNTEWDDGTTNKLNQLIFKIEDGKLKIKEHYYIETTTSTKTRETITSTPETITNYTSVDGIYYLNY